MKKSSLDLDINILTPGKEEPPSPVPTPPPTEMDILAYISIIILVYTSIFINLVSVSLMPTSDHLWVYWYIKSNSRPTRSITSNYKHNDEWHIPTWNLFSKLLVSKPPSQPVYRSSILSDLPEDKPIVNQSPSQSHLSA